MIRCASALGKIPYEGSDLTKDCFIVRDAVVEDLRKQSIIHFPEHAASWATLKIPMKWLEVAAKAIHAQLPGGGYESSWYRSSKNGHSRGGRLFKKIGLLQENARVKEGKKLKRTAKRRREDGSAEELVAGRQAKYRKRLDDDSAMDTTEQLLPGILTTADNYKAFFECYKKLLIDQNMRKESGIFKRCRALYHFKGHMVKITIPIYSLSSKSSY